MPTVRLMSWANVSTSAFWAPLAGIETTNGNSLRVLSRIGWIHLYTGSVTMMSEIVSSECTRLNIFSASSRFLTAKLFLIPLTLKYVEVERSPIKAIFPNFELSLRFVDAVKTV